MLSPIHVLYACLGTIAASSSITFVLYCWDKSAAKRDTNRISERTLLMWSLCGGWPGAVIASRVVYHKTKKQPYVTRFRIATITNILFWTALFAYAVLG